jgi:hypothetical protein
MSRTQQLRDELRALLLAGDFLGIGQEIGQVVEELRELGVTVPPARRRHVPPMHDNDEIGVWVEAMDDAALWRVVEGGRDS